MNRLPTIIADCERRWSLAVGPPFPELLYNYVAPAVRADGTAAVLKLSLPQEPGFKMEAEALRLFDGRGAVRLLELDFERDAMLLERLEPGVPLSTVEHDGEATSIAADLYQVLLNNLASHATFGHQW